MQPEEAGTLPATRRASLPYVAPRRCCRGSGADVCCGASAGPGGFPGDPVPESTTTTTAPSAGGATTTTTLAAGQACSTSNDCPTGECCGHGRCCKPSGGGGADSCAGGAAIASCCLSQKISIAFDPTPGVCGPGTPADCPLQTDCVSYYEYVCGHCVDTGTFFSGFCNVLTGSPCGLQ